MQTRTIAIHAIQEFLVDLRQPSGRFNESLVDPPIYVECILVQVDELLHLQLVLTRHLARDNQANGILEAFLAQWPAWLTTNLSYFNQVEFVSDESSIYLHHEVMVLLY